MQLSPIPLAVALMLAAAPAQAQHAGHGVGDARPQAEQERQAPSRIATPPLSLPTGPRQVQVTIGESGFEPSEIQANAGDSVTLRITRVTENTCAREVNFHGRGVQVAVPLGLELKVTIDVDEPGVVRFGCLSGTDGAVIRVAERVRR